MNRTTSTTSARSPAAPHPSLSLPAASGMPAPRLLHSLKQSGQSVLSVVTDENYIFNGSEAHTISVWCRKTYQLKTTLNGHAGSILSLELAPEKRWLISASGDSTIRIWSTESLTLLYILHPSHDMDAGDIFSLVWCCGTQTIIFGCQNTSIQWFDCTTLDSSTAISPGSTPLIADSASVASVDSDKLSLGLPSSLRRGQPKVHKFFDSYPQSERKPADEFAMNGVVGSPPASQPGCVDGPPAALPLAAFDIPPENEVDSAHYGYVYAMVVLPSTRDGSDDILPLDSKFGWHLVTGSGDETIKVWTISHDGITPVHTFDCGRGAVLSLVTRGDTIYAGCQDGYVTIWDLETRTLVRSIIVHENLAVLSLSMLNSDLYTCCEDGQVKRWSASFDCTGSWRAHDGIVLSSIVTRANEASSFELITGGNDGHIKVWEVNASMQPVHGTGASLTKAETAHFRDSASIDDTMVFALSKFVSIPSVSKSSVHQEDCRQAAIWLRKCLTQLGADSSVISTGEKTSPLVLATFSGTQTSKPKRRILFYGHYDVIAAPAEGWISDPFALTGRNGYLYGRGVTDNKGPILAVACAAAELLRRRALEVDLVFLVEGEEEAGSGGFEAAVKRNRSLIGQIDCILVSNSTWITEDPPCITYGLRGVVHCGLEIKSKLPDLHSGVEGGANVEPMLDMVKVLAKLVDGDRQVLVPGFYDRVRPITDEEKRNYMLLSGITQRPASSLSAKWREPSLTIHNVEVSGPNNSTVIPQKVNARISVRIVPDQDLDTIAASLCEYVKASFREIHSPNSLTVSVDHTADWWLGDLEDPWFKALENAVRDEWGTEPLRIREGGSIPSIPFLEKEFKCHALHLPMGQSSDQAHLPNERISLANLRRGKSVVEKFLVAGAGMASS